MLTVQGVDELKGKGRNAEQPACEWRGGWVGGWVGGGASERRLVLRW